MKIGDYEVKVTSKDTVEVGCVKVTRAQVEQVCSMMNEWKPAAPKFKVGDFVKVVGCNDIVQKDRVGEFGKVVSAKGPDKISGKYGVEFMRKVASNHDCDYATKYGHGVWFRAEMLELVD